MTTAQRTKCEIYTRVMGYYRPVSHFNIGKKSEFYSREYFTQPQHSNNVFNTKFNSPSIDYAYCGRTENDTPRLSK